MPYCNSHGAYETVCPECQKQNREDLEREIARQGRSITHKDKNG